MHPFTLVFLAALVATTALRLWLNFRQLRYVLAHRDSVPPAFAGVMTLPAHQKAADYTAAKTRLALVHVLVDAVLVLALTLGGGLQFLADFWAGRLPGELPQGVALVASVALVAGASEIPLSAYRVFGIEARFGFNRMTPLMFVSDLAKQALLAAALGIPLVTLVLVLMSKAGAYWWLYAWFAWMAFNLLVLALYPTLIAPLFNKFTPLEDLSLKERIERLAARCGFKAQGLFVMDGSRRSSHGNAYFTGFGKTKRIVLFDTLLARLDPAEVEAVLAHELGHFRRRHVAKRIAWTFAMSLLFLALLGRVAEKPWFYQGLNVATSSPAMALTLFFLVVPLFVFPFQPLLSYYSRRHEFEADQYAAQHASAADLVQALVKLYRENAATLTPDPVHSAFYDSHPPAAVRIARLAQHGA